MKVVDVVAAFDGAVVADVVGMVVVAFVCAVVIFEFLLWCDAVRSCCGCHRC